MYPESIDFQHVRIFIMTVEGIFHARHMSWSA